MKIKNLILFLLVSASANAQNIDNQKIDNYINHIETNNRGIGSVSIFKDSKEVYNRSFGQSKLENIAFDANTKYQVGSITKLITATLIFKLVENNQLKLDDKLSTFYPLIPNSNKITIKNLLEHSSGLGDYLEANDSIPLINDKLTEKEIINKIISQGVGFEPNKKVNYSNSGYYLLTKILESKFKSDYSTIVENEISKPLNLENFTSIKDNISNVFKSYKFDTKWQEIKEFSFFNAIGVGDIASTTKDLNSFITSLFQYKILKKETVELMKLTSKKAIFSMGLMVTPFYKNTYLGHSGDTYGTHSNLLFNEKNNVAICYSINGERFSKTNFEIGLLSILHNRKYDFPIFKQPIKLNSEELDKYIGIYSTPDPSFRISIFKEGNILKAQEIGKPASQIDCYEIDKFEYEAEKLKFEFDVKKNKMILSHERMKPIVMKKE